MVTLHGKEIKVGDRVWSLRHGWLHVSTIKENKTYPIETEQGTFTENGKCWEMDTCPTLFWQEMILTPKPEPEYEWQWLYFSMRYKAWDTSGYHKTSQECIDNLKGNAFCYFDYDQPIYKLEQTKREVKAN